MCNFSKPWSIINKVDKKVYLLRAVFTLRGLRNVTLQYMYRSLIMFHCTSDMTCISLCLFRISQSLWWISRTSYWKKNKKLGRVGAVIDMHLAPPYLLFTYITFNLPAVKPDKWKRWKHHLILYLSCQRRYAVSFTWSLLLLFHNFSNFNLLADNHLEPLRIHQSGILMSTFLFWGCFRGVKFCTLWVDI